MSIRPLAKVVLRVLFFASLRLCVRQKKIYARSLLSIIEVVDNRRTKTNRRLMLRAAYKPSDFDFALVYIEKLDLFYIFPVDVFISYGSEIHLVETEKRQRQPRSAQYRQAWELISQAIGKENCVFSPEQFGETGF